MENFVAFLWGKKMDGCFPFRGFVCWWKLTNRNHGWNFQVMVWLGTGSLGFLGLLAWIPLGIPLDQRDSYWSGLPSLKLTANAPWKGKAIRKGKDRLPTIHFQVRTVSFREGSPIRTPNRQVTISWTSWSSCFELPPIWQYAIWQYQIEKKTHLSPQMWIWKNHQNNHYLWWFLNCGCFWP